MNINSNNYESWFLDYYEGALSVEQVSELFLFLEKYPELKHEFDSFTLVSLPKPTEVFSLKNSLRKNTVTLENYTAFLIAELEGDLNLQERVALKSFMEVYPELEKDKLLFSKTILQKEAVVYAEKRNLKKPVLAEHGKNFNAVWIAAAAMILLLIGVYFIQAPEKPKITQQETSQNENGNKKKKNTNSDAPIRNNIKKEAVEIQDDNLNSLELSVNNLASNNSKTKTNPSHNKKRNRIYVAANQMVNNSTELAMISTPRLESHLTTNTIEATPGKVPVEIVSSQVIRSKRSFNPLQLFDDAKIAVAEKLNHATGDEILYASAKSNKFAEDRLPFKSRMIKLVAWVVNKVSNDKVKVNTDFDFDGNLASCQVTAGKIKVEKNF